MHEVRQKLLDLSKTTNLFDLSYRIIAKKIGVKHANTVRYHLGKLKDEGLIRNEIMSKTDFSGLVDIPVLGEVNCGEAVIYAELLETKQVTISKDILQNSKPKDVIGLKAVGNSMNKANIAGSYVEEGDIVLFDTSITEPDSGDYVLSVIDDCANLKKFEKDRNYIVLVSDSTANIEPIYIKSDNLRYIVNGKAIAVLPNAGPNELTYELMYE